MLMSLSELCREYKIAPAGVLHIGAHEGEERDVYQSCGFTKVVWIEANPDLATALSQQVKTTTKGFESETVINAAITNTENESVEFHITNNGQSSSLRQFGSHALYYPAVTVDKTIRVRTRRIQNIFSDDKRLSDGITFVNLDIQGVELEALMSFGPYLNQVSWVYTEVNRNDVYRGNALIWDIDLFLLQHGFLRRETRWTGMEWGDAFYSRDPGPLSSLFRIREQLRLRTVKAWFRAINSLKFVKRSILSRTKAGSTEGLSN